MTNMHLLEACKLRFKCGVKLTGKRARRGRKVTERKMGNMHLLEVCKAICKDGKSAKSDGKKARQYAFIRSMSTIFKYDGKKGGKDAKSVESDGKKDGQYAFS
jgi:hypothetical protein